MIADDIAGREPVVRITDLAREKVLRVRAEQPNPERLALKIEVIGISGGEYESTPSFALLEDAGPDDVVQHHDGLAIVIPADSRSSPSRSTRASPPTAATPSSSPSRTRPPTCAWAAAVRAAPWRLSP